VTPYDIPYVPDGAPWPLTVAGRVGRPLHLDWPICGPDPRLLLAEAGVEPDAVDVVFTGADPGVERGVEQDQDAGDEGEPVTRIAPRALLVPPGFPDFMSRGRVVRPGTVTIEGRTWYEAELEPESGRRWAWRRRLFDWTATPGEYELSARATDAEGHTQPLEQPYPTRRTEPRQAPGGVRERYGSSFSRATGPSVSSLRLAHSRVRGVMSLPVARTRSSGDTSVPVLVWSRSSGVMRSSDDPDASGCDVGMVCSLGPDRFCYHHSPPTRHVHPERGEKGRIRP